MHSSANQTAETKSQRAARVQRTRIKICGITRPEDAGAVAAAGADAIGLVFTPKSKRWISIDQARAICAQLPPFVARVALFMDQSAAEIAQVLQQIHIDLLQFHGQESAAFCASFQRPFIKALAMGGSDPAQLAQPEAWQRLWSPWTGPAIPCQGLLLDAHQPGESGGQGQVFDWQLWPRSAPLPLILAGGLGPANVAAAVRATRPYAVDVSSGVESAPGIKDHALIYSFVEEVRRGDTG